VLGQESEVQKELVDHGNASLDTSNGLLLFRDVVVDFSIGGSRVDEGMVSDRLTISYIRNRFP